MAITRYLKPLRPQVVVEAQLVAGLRFQGRVLVRVVQEVGAVAHLFIKLLVQEIHQLQLHHQIQTQYKVMLVVMEARRQVRGVLVGVVERLKWELLDLLAVKEGMGQQQ